MVISLSNRTWAASLSYRRRTDRQTTLRSLRPR